jgi:hypothetical protein
MWTCEKCGYRNSVSLSDECGRCGAPNAGGGPQSVATAIQGSGTGLFGQQGFKADGSYLTTLFFSLFWLPILPLETLRVRKVGGHSSFLGPFHRSGTRYEILDRCPVRWDQVIRVWCFVGIVIRCFFIGGDLVGKPGVARHWALVAFWGSIVAPFLVRASIRRWARLRAARIGC